MILDEKFQYRITRDDLLQLKTTSYFPCMPKVLQNLCVKQGQGYKVNKSYTDFRKYLVRNLDQLLTFREEEFNLIIYDKVAKLVEKYPEEFPEEYGYYSVTLIAKAYAEGKLIWNQLDD